MADGSVIDVERRIVAWQYKKMGAAWQIRDGHVWFVAPGLSPGDHVLIATKVPHEPAIKSLANVGDDELLVIHPGMDVELQLQVGGTPESEKARQAVLDKLKQNGFNVVPQSSVKLVGSIQPGKSQPVVYRTRGRGLTTGLSPQTVTDQVLSLSFQVGHETVWKFESHTALTSCG